MSAARIFHISASHLVDQLDVRSELELVLGVTILSRATMHHAQTRHTTSDKAEADLRLTTLPPELAWIWKCKSMEESRFVEIHYGFSAILR
jgi:hypothetical protein